MASVFLGDLDDFIQPSQSCVNPMFSDKTKTTQTAQISLDSGFNSGLVPKQPDLIKPDASNNAATVSLTDCLACSGCVTSAETVLITQQSVPQFLSTLETCQFRKSVVSISPQSTASIATHFGLSATQTFRKLVFFFKQHLRIDMVLDTSCSADIALLEARAEFITRYKNNKQNPVPSSSWQKPKTSLAVSSMKTHYPEEDRYETTVDYHANSHNLSNLPLLTSACPGWVCYAEKSQPNAIPYISTTKSPQQIIGSVIKHIVAPDYGLSPNEVYHVTVMPCYDKKLEASRKDFYNEKSDCNDIDSVLATSEILELIELKGIDFIALSEECNLSDEEMKLSNIALDGNNEVVVQSGSGFGSKIGSGGYLEHVFRFAAKELYGVEIAGELEYIKGRNNDFMEVSLVVNGTKVLNFALAYGFRNIQTILMKIKRKKCAYDFVEIMACPSGCLNGGGQIKAASSSDSKQLIDKVDVEFKKYRLYRNPLENPICRHIYETYFEGIPFSKKARELLHTRYHAVPKMELMNPLGIKW